MNAPSYLPGSWFGVVRPRAVVLLDETIAPERLQAVWNVAGEEPTLDQLIEVVTGGRFVGAPLFGIAVLDGNRLRIVVRAGVTAVVGESIGAARSIVGGNANTWVEEILDEPQSIRLVREPVSSSHYTLPVTGGIVLADQVTWTPTSLSTPPSLYSIPGQGLSAAPGASNAAPVSPVPSTGSNDSEWSVWALDEAGKLAGGVPGGTELLEPVDRPERLTVEPGKESPPVPLAPLAPVPPLGYEPPNYERPKFEPIAHEPIAQEPPSREPLGDRLFGREPQKHEPLGQLPPPAYDQPGYDQPAYDQPAPELPPPGRDRSLIRERSAGRDLPPPLPDPLELPPLLGGVLPPLLPEDRPESPFEPPLEEHEQYLPDDGDPIGYLYFSSGQVVPVDRPVIVGRAPSVDWAQRPDNPRLVKIDNVDQDISRNHVEIRVEGSHVVAVDLNSSNGTLVTSPGEAAQRLIAQQPFLMLPGSVVTLSDEINFSFEDPE